MLWVPRRRSGADDQLGSRRLTTRVLALAPTDTTLELRPAQESDDGAPVGAIRCEIGALERGEQRDGFVVPDGIAGADRGMASHGRKCLVDSVGEAAGAGARYFGQQVAQQPFRAAALEQPRHTVYADHVSPADTHLEPHGANLTAVLL